MSTGSRAPSIPIPATYPWLIPSRSTYASRLTLAWNNFLRYLFLEDTTRPDPYGTLLASWEDNTICPSHDFRCSKLDIKALPRSFRGLLRKVERLVFLKEPYVPKELDGLVLEELVEEKTRTIPEPDPKTLNLLSLKQVVHCAYTSYEQWNRALISQGWRHEKNIACKLQLIDLVIHRSKLEDSIACLPQSTETCEIDLMISLKSLSRFTIKALGFGRGGSHELGIPACPIVTQRKPGEDPVPRLRSWCRGHFQWMEQYNNPKNTRNTGNTRAWPIPFFYVVDENWTFGFAVKTGDDVTLYSMSIGSSRWTSGVCMILTVLDLVVRWLNRTYRQKFDNKMNVTRYPRHDSALGRSRTHKGRHSGQRGCVA